MRILSKKRNIIILFSIISSFRCIAFNDINIKHLDVDAGLPNSNIADITQSKDGSIWFGTTQGLSRFDVSRFSNYDTATSDLSGNATNALSSVSNG